MSLGFSEVWDVGELGSTCFLSFLGFGVRLWVWGFWWYGMCELVSLFYFSVHFRLYIVSFSLYLYLHFYLFHWRHG